MRLASRPPTNEPTRPATIAMVQSMRPDFLPRISWASAPMSMPKRISPRMSMRRD
jgi:hypothetical protein